MQNHKKDPINIQHKCVVVITKPKYRINNVFSWVTQNVEEGKLTENVSYPNIYNLKKLLADQTAFRLNKFLRSNNNKQGVLIDPFEKCLETPYYIVGDNLDTINFENNNYIANELYTNDRLVSCNVTQETDNAWSCSIVLNNTDDLYTLKNEYYYNSTNTKTTFFANTNFGQYILNQENTCVIEPNDEVQVFMSNWQGKLNSVFTGLVSSVSLNDDGLNKTVNLECSDILKKLSWTYKVVKASFDPKEAFGTTLSVYNENYSDKTLTQVTQSLLGEALCDIYRRDSFLIRAVKSYIRNKKGNKEYSLSVVIQNEINKYIQPEWVPYELRTVKEQKDNKSNKFRIVGYKCSIDYKKLLNNYNIVDANMLNLDIIADYKDGDMAFEITGTEQPAWGWTINSGSFDYLFSTFKRNDDFIREIANIVAYEVFADSNGIVLFRPPNLLLPKQADFENKQFTEIFNEYIDNYIVTTDKEENYFISFLTTTDDNAIYTQVAVTGAFVENNISIPFQKAKAYAPLQYINQYGTRMMQPITRVGLQTAEACKRYGELLLWRQNKNYELGSATCILNADYTVGMPIFIQKQLAVWYIKRVSHSFTAGQSCTTSLTLGYKRKPMCYKKDLKQYLATSLEQGKISKTEYDRIKKNQNYLMWGILDLNYTPMATMATIANGNVVVQPKDNSQYLLVWEMIPIDLFENLMLYHFIEGGAKKAVIRKNKTTKTLAIKANKNFSNYFANMAKQVTKGDVETLPIEAVKLEQLKVITTPDAQIMKAKIIDTKKFEESEVLKDPRNQVLIITPWSEKDKLPFKEFKGVQ